MSMPSVNAGSTFALTNQMSPMNTVGMYTNQKPVTIGGQQIMMSQVPMNVGEDLGMKRMKM